MDEFDDLENEDLEGLDLTGTLPDTMLEHDSPYLPAVLLVDNVLKAETKQEAAHNNDFMPSSECLRLTP